MEVVYPRCCGLDIHKDVLVACRITPGERGRPHKEVETFGATTDEILRLGDWLAEAGCTHLAMESTGVYWQPIWNLLEGQLELLLVNAQHIKATSADYPHRQHGLLGRDGQSHRPYASALRPDPPAG